MKILNKLLIVLLVLSLVSVSAIAAEVISVEDEELPFEVTVETVKDMIDFQENARFKITIKNHRQ